jgi:hypothetical protein
VCFRTVYSEGARYRDSAQISPRNELNEACLQMKFVDGVRWWREKGSVTCEKTPGVLYSVGTFENIAGLLASFSYSPRRSVRKVAQALGLSNMSVWRILLSDLILHHQMVLRTTVRDSHGCASRLFFPAISSWASLLEIRLITYN